MDTPTLYLFKRAADSQWIFGENSDCECSSGKYRIVPSADRTTVTIYEYGIENYIYYNVPFGNFKNEAGAAYASFAALKAGYAGFFFSVGKEAFYTKEESIALLAQKSAISGSIHKVVASNVQLNNTGNTNENTVLTATIPANSIGVNGSFHITLLVGQTNNANAKTIKVKFNGTQVCQAGVISCACYQSYSIIRNRNSLSSQVAMYAASAASGAFVSGTSGAVSTFSINTAADITVTVTIQNATGTDTVSLEAFEILAVQ